MAYLASFKVDRSQHKPLLLLDKCSIVDINSTGSYCPFVHCNKCGFMVAAAREITTKIWLNSLSDHIDIVLPYLDFVSNFN